jgi:Glycosyltransferase
MYIVHICPRIKEVHGGGEPVLYHLTRELCELGHNNAVLTMRIPHSQRSLFDKRIIIKEIPALWKEDSGNLLITGFLELCCMSVMAAKIPKEADAICFHTEATIFPLFFYKVFGGRKPCLYFCYQPPRFAYDLQKDMAKHGKRVSLILPIFNAIYRPFDKLAVRLSDKTATFSNGYKQWIESIYGIKDVVVLAPGVERLVTPVALPRKMALTLSKPGIKIILSVGKLVAWKNVDRLINITSLLKKRIPSVCLLVVGGGPCMDSLRKQAAAANLLENNDVVFAGYVSHNDIFAYYNKADLLVLLEKNASFGLSLIEANATGLPVIAYKGGGPSDIIEEGKNGFLLPNDYTDKEIANSITNFLLSSDAKIKEISNYSKSLSEKYTWKRFAENFIQTIAELRK